jgi:uncharacterized protein
MDVLFEFSNHMVDTLADGILRLLLDEIDWKQRLIVIKGARGVGKTTLMLQRLKNLPPKEALYVSCDHFYFLENRLFDTVRQFHRQGGKVIFIDEVHKYEDWSREIKNIYDTFPQLKVVLSSSSILNLLKGNGDLSRRLAVYELNGLSFREFVQIESGKKLPVFSLSQILEDPNVAIAKIKKEIVPLAYWDDYIKYGYFPFYKENIQQYYNRLMNIINVSIEMDLVQCKPIDTKHLFKIKRLLSAVAASVPFTPNIEKLSGLIEVTRLTTINYLDYLHDAKLLTLLKADNIRAISPMVKPDKIYLQNTNFMYAFDKHHVDIGNLRETFFLNQVSAQHKVNTPEDKGDFLVDSKYLFEVGGRGKTKQQIKNNKNAYIASDDIDIAVGNKLPLWLFGFLY